MSADLRTLADIRVREASVLVAAGEPSGAYYLAGYALECALKAVITRGLSAYTMPEP
ncbi:MAG: DNA-binding protein, partial [Actinobacteria bacterium]|nr:DNA-binding protein [Actinomycetota bacterium]